jgi:predicted NBD/HSP70 family sugar kinase
MSRPTVSVIANELLTSGVLMEGDRVSSGGAPGTLLEIAKDTGVTLVVDLREVDHVILATVSPGGEVVKRATTSVRDEAELLARVGEFAATVERASLIGAAIAVHGFIDPSGHWQYDATRAMDVSVLDQLRKQLRMDVWPVYATDAITLADLRDSDEGLAAQATVVVRGIAIGLVIDGHILTGSKRPAGDIAHIVVADDGPVCTECGKTCLFATVGQLYLGQDTALARQESATGIAAVMAPVCAVAEVEEIVLALLPDACAEEVCQTTQARLRELLPFEHTPTVRLSTQGEDAVLIGAALMYLHKRLI